MHPPSEARSTLAALASATPVQKAARRNKMATYLAKTHEKARAIIESGRQQGVSIAAMEAVRHIAVSASYVADNYSTQGICSIAWCC